MPGPAARGAAGAGRRGVRRPDRAEAPQATRGAARPRRTRATTWTPSWHPPGPGERVPLDADTAMSHGSAEAALARRRRRRWRRWTRCAGGEARRAFCAVRPPGHHAEPAAADGLLPLLQRRDRRPPRPGGARRWRASRSSTSTSTTATAPRPASRTTRRSSSPPSTSGRSTPAPARRRSAAWATSQRPLPPGADGAAFRARLGEQLLPALDDFAPDLLLISAGFDAHRARPAGPARAWRGGLRLADRRASARLAERHCGGRVVSLLEGGYDLDALASSAAAHVRA